MIDALLVTTSMKMTPKSFCWFRIRFSQFDSKAPLDSFIISNEKFTFSKCLLLFFSFFCFIFLSIWISHCFFVRFFFFFFFCRFYYFSYQEKFSIVYRQSSIFNRQSSDIFTNFERPVFAHPHIFFPQFFRYQIWRWFLDTVGGGGEVRGKVWNTLQN